MQIEMSRNERVRGLRETKNKVISAREEHDLKSSERACNWSWVAQWPDVSHPVVSCSTSGLLVELDKKIKEEA
jgi:hypothetical protein